MLMDIETALKIADTSHFMTQNKAVLDVLAAEVRRLQVSHKRYETLLRLNVPAFRALLEANLVIGKPFDELVDDLGPFMERSRDE